MLTVISQKLQFDLCSLLDSLLPKGLLGMLVLALLLLQYYSIYQLA